LYVAAAEETMPKKCKDQRNGFAPKRGQDP
jgi:hypothetical protein